MKVRVYLGRITLLRDLDLTGCQRMTDDSMVHLTLLTSLTRLNLRDCEDVADEGTMFLGSLTALRNLDLGHCNRITDIGLGHLASLTLLTRLILDDLDKITDMGLECLGTLKGLGDLSLNGCERVSIDVANRYHDTSAGRLGKIMGAKYHSALYCGMLAFLVTFLWGFFTSH